MPRVNKNAFLFTLAMLTFVIFCCKQLHLLWMLTLHSVSQVDALELDDFSDRLGRAN